LLEGDATAETGSLEPPKRTGDPTSVTPTRVCPSCGGGRLVVIGEFPAGAEMAAGVEVYVGLDSS
jgi:hypothetical protein